MQKSSRSHSGEATSQATAGSAGISFGSGTDAPLAAAATATAPAALVPAVPPGGDVVSLMSRTLGAANRYLVALMAREGIVGIVPSHGDILMQLFAHDAMPMAALAEAIGKDPSTVTALVRKLADAGYVEKVPNARDRRVCEVCLTDAGRALAPAMERVSAELIATLTNDVAPDDLACTCRTMKAMQANLTAASDATREAEREQEHATSTADAPKREAALHPER